MATKKKQVDFNKLRTELKTQISEGEQSGISKDQTLKNIRSRLTKAGKLEGLKSEFTQNKTDPTTSPAAKGGVATGGIPGVTTDTSVKDIKVDTGIVGDDTIDTTTETPEQKTLRERVVGRIAGRKTEEQKLQETREEAGRGELVDLQKGFREEAAAVQTDIENIRAGLEAEGGAITSIAASRIREARSAPLREQLTSLVKGQQLTSANLKELDDSIDGILKARELDRQNEVATLTNQIEGSDLSSAEKNKLLTQLGQQTARMKQESEIEAFKQKEEIKADIEQKDLESLAKTGLTAEQNLQSATIIQDFDVKEDSIAGQSIRNLLKQGKTPDQIRKILGLATDSTGKISDEQFTRQEKLRKEFESSASAKNYMVAVQQFAGIQQTLKAGTGPGDMASIFQFMKILDPTSVVREAEFDSAARSIGISESLSNFFSPDGKVKGAILTKEGREQFRQIAEKLFQNRKETFDARATKFITLSKEAGANPRSVILDFENIPGFSSDLSEKDFAPIGPDSSDDETIRFLNKTGNTLGKDSNDTDIGTFLDEDFNEPEQTGGTNTIPTIGFTEKVSIVRTGTNVAKDTNNPGNITADSIPSGFNKEEYAKRIGATGTYLSPNGREYFVFPDVAAGTKALTGDLTAKISGNSRNIKPSDTLARFQRVYVGEVSPGYLAVLKRITGADENTPISEIDPAKLTQAVMEAEGFTKGLQVIS